MVVWSGSRGGLAERRQGSGWRGCLVLIMTGPVLGGSVLQLPERLGGHSTLRISEDDIQKTGYSPRSLSPPGLAPGPANYCHADWAPLSVKGLELTLSW